MALHDESRRRALAGISATASVPMFSSRTSSALAAKPIIPGEKRMMIVTSAANAITHNHEKQLNWRFQSKASEWESVGGKIRAQHKFRRVSVLAQRNPFKKHVFELTPPPDKPAHDIIEALTLIGDGEDINFVGAGSACSFDESGDQQGNGSIHAGIRNGRHEFARIIT